MINRCLKRLKKAYELQEDFIDVIITVAPSLIFRLIRRLSVTGSKGIAANSPQIHHTNF